jgi:methionyl-tRNA formyltransferase
MVTSQIPTGRVRVIFFGTPEFAVPTLDALAGSVHAVAGVVTQPDRPSGRGHLVQPTPVKARATALGLPIWQPERIREPGFLDAMRELHADLGVVAAYGKILPDALLAIPRLGMINVHASLLPRWRGASPIQRAVMAGDRETGVTIIRLVAALDAGPMLATVTRPIASDETAGEVEAALASLGAALLVEVVHRLSRGDVHEQPQDETLVTYAPRLTKDDGVVDWTRTAPQVQCFIRGVQPWPGASTMLAGERLRICRSAVADETPVGEPGTIVTAHGDELIVACGAATALRVTELQPEGRRPMRARDFLAGRRLLAGARFHAGAPA